MLAVLRPTPPRSPHTTVRTALGRAAADHVLYMSRLGKIYILYGVGRLYEGLISADRSEGRCRFRNSPDSAGQP